MARTAVRLGTLATLVLAAAAAYGAATANPLPGAALASSVVAGIEGAAITAVALTLVLTLAVRGLMGQLPISVSTTSATYPEQKLIETQTAATAALSAIEDHLRQLDATAASHEAEIANTNEITSALTAISAELVDRLDAIERRG